MAERPRDGPAGRTLGHDSLRRAVRPRHHLPRRRPVDLEDCEALAAADVVVVGAPLDGGTSHRPGTRFGPQAIRQTDYLPHDGSRPHLALRVDALQDLRVARRRRRRDAAGGAGDVAARTLEEAVYAVASQGTIPLVLGGDHSIALAGRDRRGPAPRLRQGLDDPLRRARRHRRHRVRLALRPRPADAPADRVRCAARRPVPADGAARLLARTRRPWAGWPSRTCGPSR